MPGDLERRPAGTRWRVNNEEVNVRARGHCLARCGVWHDLARRAGGITLPSAFPGDDGSLLRVEISEPRLHGVGGDGEQRPRQRRFSDAALLGHKRDDDRHGTFQLVPPYMPAHPISRQGVFNGYVRWCHDVNTSWKVPWG